MVGQQPRHFDERMGLLEERLAKSPSRAESRFRQSRAEIVTDEFNKYGA